MVYGWGEGGSAEKGEGEGGTTDQAGTPTKGLKTGWLADWPGLSTSAS